MALAFDRSSQTDASHGAARTPRPVDPDRAGERTHRFSRHGEPAGGQNSISASQARAARRREARRDQQAVAAWLRELSR